MMTLYLRHDKIYENNPVAQQDEVRKLKCTFRIRKVEVVVVEAESRNFEVLFILGHNIYSSALCISFDVRRLQEQNAPAS